jgi:glutathione S-transferase
MRLYHSPTSPYVRKVMVLLMEAGRADAVTLVPAAGTPVDPQTMPVAQNPLGKIPCLEREDGPSLYDSRVICRYLDATLKAGMYPDAPRLWDTLVLEATGDGILDAAILMRYETHVRPGERQFEPWLEGQWAKVDRTLDALEGRWMAHLHGPLDMGQVAVACALAYLDFRHEARDWRKGRPALEAWEAKIAARDSFRATVPPA